MEESNNPRTARDALTIELMGDIGRLDDQIKALPNTLNEALTPTLGAKQKASLQNFVSSEKNTMREVIRTTLQEEAGKALANAARELETSARIHQNAVNRQTKQRWQWLGVAFVVGMGAAIVTTYGLHLRYGQQFEQQVAYGHALGSVWGSLDAKTKKRIQDAVVQD